MGAIIEHEVARAERVVRDLRDLDGVRGSGERVAEDLSDADKDIKSTLEHVAERVVGDPVIAKDLREAVERLQSIPETVEQEYRLAAEALERLEDRLFQDLPAVRVRVAARLLDISAPSVYKWIQRGLLHEVEDGTSVRKVCLRDVYSIQPHVAALRKLGKNRNLLEAILLRIDDDGTVENRSLRKSVDEMVRREGLVDITPADE